MDGHSSQEASALGPFTGVVAILSALFAAALTFKRLGQLPSDTRLLIVALATTLAFARLVASLANGLRRLVRTSSSKTAKRRSAILATLLIPFATGCAAFIGAWL